jgi:hypothetical protein
MAPLPKNDQQVHLWVPSEVLKRWKAAADAAGFSLSLWIRRACDLSIDDTDTKPTKKGKRQ